MKLLKKIIKPSDRRVIACELQKRYGISERMAARVMAISQNTKRYTPVYNPENDRITVRLKELSARYPRYGHRRFHILLLREGEQINEKRTYRLSREVGLALKKKTKKRRYEKRGMSENPQRIYDSFFIKELWRNGKDRAYK